MTTQVAIVPVFHHLAALSLSFSVSLEPDVFFWRLQVEAGRRKNRENNVLFPRGLLFPIFSLLGGERLSALDTSLRRRRCCFPRKSRKTCR